MDKQDFKEVSVGIAFRDELRFFKNQNNQWQLTFIGCESLSNLVLENKKLHGQDPHLWPLPVGLSHSELLLREFLLKLKNQWVPVYAHEELCHCRKVSAQEVEQAILCGAHTSEAVSRWTGASTACGTCRPEVEKILQERLQR